MLRRGEGWVVNVSSGAGSSRRPASASYAASKFGLTGLTEGLWLDLAGSNVHATVVHVGPIDTEIWRRPTSRRRSAAGSCRPRRVGRHPPRHRAAAPRGVGARRMRLAWWFRLLAPDSSAPALHVRSGSARADRAGAPSRARRVTLSQRRRSA
jgi:short-subunit dehydrogenase